MPIRNVKAMQRKPTGLEMSKVSGRRLGRLKPAIPPHKDPKVLHLADYLPKKPGIILPDIRPYRDWSAWANDQLHGDFGMMLNDQLGDCTVAAVGHAVQVMTAVAGSVFTPSDADILAMYRASGYAGTPDTDNGWFIQSALRYWQRKGLAGHHCYAYLAVDPQNMTHVDLALEIFGFVDIGIGLPLSAQNQNMCWSVPESGLIGDGQPASWGGHSVIVCKRSPNPVLRRGLITWGIDNWRITPNFWQAYVDECWVVFSLDWLRSNNLSALGMNQQQLMDDLSAVSN